MEERNCLLFYIFVVLFVCFYGNFVFSFFVFLGIKYWFDLLRIVLFRYGGVKFYGYFNFY